MSRVLVTGGAGFLGSHLCDALLKKGHDVVCLDNFFTGSRAFIEHLNKNRAFSLIEHDVTLPFYQDSDMIYCLACPASPMHYQVNAIRTIKTSILGSIHALGLAKRMGAKILLSSTSEVYGDPDVHPQPESYWGHVNPIGPRSCYDEGKRCAESLFMNYHDQHQVTIKIARIFNTYGPRMHPGDGRVVSNFIVQALRGEEITIYGTGDQSRSFCYVSDMVRGLCLLMETASDVTGPINLGMPEECTMLELAELILRLTKSSSKLKFFPLPTDDPVRRKPDISQAKSVLDWAPTIGLEEGLTETIAYFKSLLAGPDYL